MRACVRGVAVTLVVAGAYLVLKRLVFAIGVGSLELALRNWTEVGEGHSFYRGAAMIVVGLAIGLLADKMSRWIVTVPSESCPRCGYAQTPAPGERCPECGLQG